MIIDAKMVEELAELSKLKLTETERDAMVADLQKMVAFVEKLQTVDTAGVPPLLHMGDAANVLREDTIQGTVSRTEALHNAPEANESFFRVPKVIRK
ncbi:MAG: Asp-tRNA(Asn)/Glu-tRNA(Gln) amidotransferase subunit GatC [Bacteroidota bacterium]